MTLLTWSRGNLRPVVSVSCCSAEFSKIHELPPADSSITASGIRCTNQEWRVLKLLAERAEPVGYHDIAAAAFTKSHETVLDRLKRKPTLGTQADTGRFETPVGAG